MTNYPKYATWCPVEIRPTLKIVENIENGQTMTCDSCKKVWKLLETKDGENTPENAYTEEELKQLKRKLDELHAK